MPADRTRKRRRPTVSNEFVSPRGEDNANVSVEHMDDEQVEADPIDVGPADVEPSPTCSIHDTFNQQNELEIESGFETATVPSDFGQMLSVTPFSFNPIETFAPMVIPSPSSSLPTERHALLNLFGATSVEHPFRMHRPEQLTKCNDACR